MFQNCLMVPADNIDTFSPIQGRELYAGTIELRHVRGNGVLVLVFRRSKVIDVSQHLSGFR